MIAAATLLWTVEVVVARRLLLGRIEPAVLGAGRLGLGLVVLVGFLAVTGRLATVTTLSPVQWAWALGTGALLAGYVATWFAALRRAPASLVTAVLVLGAPITAALTTLVNGTLPAPTVLAGDGLILVAVAAIATLSARRLRPIG
jgi:drug/metabolite transporter (DMT)-like permease